MIFDSVKTKSSIKKECLVVSHAVIFSKRSFNRLDSTTPHTSTAGCVLCDATQDKEYTTADQTCACLAANGFSVNVAAPLMCQCDANKGYASDQTETPAWMCECQTGAGHNFKDKQYSADTLSKSKYFCIIVLEV